MHLPSSRDTSVKRMLISLIFVSVLTVSEASPKKDAYKEKEIACLGEVMIIHSHIYPSLFSFISINYKVRCSGDLEVYI